MKHRDTEAWEQKYGEPYSWFEQQFKTQHGMCAICYVNPIQATDHCHYCGELRKLLCVRCNTGIGAFKENLDLTLRAYQYLKDHYDQYKHIKLVIPENVEELLNVDWEQELGTILNKKDGDTSKSSPEAS